MDSHKSPYDAYKERHQLMMNQAPLTMLNPDQFHDFYKQLAEGYELYDNYIQMGDFETARNYFREVIWQLENELMLRM